MDLDNIEFGSDDRKAENGTIGLEDLNIVLDGLIGNDEGKSLLGGLVAGLKKFSLKANEEEDGNFGMKGLINDNKDSSNFGLDNFGLFVGNITGDFGLKNLVSALNSGDGNFGLDLLTTNANSSNPELDNLVSEAFGLSGLLSGNRKYYI